MNPAACVACEMSRRGFVTAATMAALSVVVTACGGDSGGITAPTIPDSGSGGGGTPPAGGPAGITRSGNVFTIDLTASNELTTDGLIVLNGAAVPALIVRAAADTYRAFDARCPHAGTSNQWELGDGFLQCNNHGSRFAASNGAVNRGPAGGALRALTATRTGSTLTVTAS